MGAAPGEEAVPGQTSAHARWVLHSAGLAAALCATIVAAGWSAAQLERALDQGVLAEDFATSVWNPGRAVLDGRDPMRSYTADGHDGGTVYQPIATLATLPLSLPPYRVAAVLWVVLLAAAVAGSLWLCGVRDWGCYLAALGSPAVVAGLMYANATLVLVLAVALVWHWRDRPWRVSPAVGLAVAAKLFLWPLVIWLALTRRWAACALSAAFAGVWSVVGWAVLGFDGLAEYPGLMRRHAAENDQDGSSMAALAAQLGLPGNQALALAVGIGAVGVAAYVRRDDLASFTWVVAAAVLASPMVWTHYYALLLVPLALAMPRWSPVWLLPFLFFPNRLDAAVGVAAVLAFATWVTLRSGVSEVGAPASPGSLLPRESWARTSSPA